MTLPYGLRGKRRTHPKNVQSIPQRKMPGIDGNSIPGLYYSALLSGRGALARRRLLRRGGRLASTLATRWA